MENTKINVSVTLKELTAAKVVLLQSRIGTESKTDVIAHAIHMLDAILNIVDKDNIVLLCPDGRRVKLTMK